MHITILQREPLTIRTYLSSTLLVSKPCCLPNSRYNLTCSRSNCPLPFFLTYLASAFSWSRDTKHLHAISNLDSILPYQLRFQSQPHMSWKAHALMRFGSVLLGVTSLPLAMTMPPNHFSKSSTTGVQMLAATVKKAITTSAYARHFQGRLSLI